MGKTLSTDDLRSFGPRPEVRAPRPDLHLVITANPDLNIVTPQLTVIIPTRNETENIGPLLDRVAAALAGIPAEVLFVDDSDDDTAAEVERRGRDLAMSVRVLQRRPDQREGGLSTAVVSGMRLARAPWALVMDADLQHPPEIIPQLFRTASRQPVDLVVASRYAGHGSSGGLDGGARRGSSRFATRIAKLAFPRRAARVSDPMSGFFAVRLAALDIHRLRPYGYKILLELIVRNAHLRVAEVSFSFAPRHAGESKTSVREVLRFGRHLARLRLQVAREHSDVARRERPGALRKLIRFGAIGLTGIAVNSAALWLLHLRVFQLHYLIAAALATQVSTLWNFVLTDRLVFKSAKAGGSGGRMWRFFLMNNLALLLRLPMLAALVHLGMGVLSANIVTLLAVFVVRYVISDRLIFARTAAPVSGTERPMVVPVKHLVDLAADGSKVDLARPKRIRYLPYRYDIAGIVSIGSQVRLPELEYFRAQWLDGDMDIAVRVGDVGRGTPMGRAVVTQFVNPTALRYEEHLGRLGANFRINFGSTIDITVGPLLARSPHVVYTNILEALLRFVVADRGKMLLHSACLELGGHGVMLSARTDTGKTGTILRLLREQGGEFLSDDMTIIDEHATALAFPKPLTISHHTLRAVQASDLSPAEWRRLKLQSRLHSKEGRSLALILARYNVPIMAINSLTQMIVPPPKYNVDRLVPCRTGASTTVRDLFLIERGEESMSEVATSAAVDELMVNTADAYGFPPFQYLAPVIVLSDGDYADLQRKERAVLSAAFASIRTRRLGSDTFSWADTIPALLEQDRRARQAAESRPSPVLHVPTARQPIADGESERLTAGE